MKKWFPLAVLLLLTGCFQTFNNDDDEELRTVPVTNNPTIVPNYGGGFPGAGMSGQAPH